MAKNSITDYSKTAASNTDIQSVDIAEGCLPSGINNAIREIMADLADMNDGTVTLTSPSFAAASTTGALTAGSATVGSTTSSAAVHSYTKLEVESSSHSALQFSGSTGGEQWIWFADDSSSTPVGGITYYHGGPYMAFRVEGSERLRIDSSGDISFYEDTGTTAKLFWDASAEALGIGTSSPDSGTPLHVAESSASLGANTTASAFLVERAGNVGMTLGTANTGTCSIFMGDSDSLTKGRVQYDNSDDSLGFWANSLERMRIDSSGSVLISTTSSDPRNFTGGASGVKLGSDQPEFAVGTMYINRSYTSEGDVLSFRKEGSTVGSIGVKDTDLYIGKFAVGLSFDSTGPDGIRPFDINSQAYRDNGIDLGGESARFNDLYLGGTAYVGTSVGIGTSSPSAGLHIDNPSNSAITAILDTDNSAVKMVFRNNTETGNNVQIGADGSNLVALTNGTERLRIDSSGRVGIGTSSPAHELTVKNGTQTPTIRIHSNTTSFPSPRLEFVRGTNDTFGGDNYSDHRIVADSGHLIFQEASSGTTNEIMRLLNNGHVSIGSTADEGILYVASSENTNIEEHRSSNSSYTSQMLRQRCNRGGSSSYYFLLASSGNTADNEAFIRGDGRIAGDAGFQTGADYAEFFEWDDGNSSDEDRRGYSVVLMSGNKIRKATSSDAAADIIGVISGHPSVVGDAAWSSWGGKFNRDDFGGYIWETYTVTEWTEAVEDGDDIEHSYQTDQIPSDVTVPADATVITQDDDGNTLKRKQVNSSYDDTQTYTPREDRQEWDAVGMVGKLRLRVGQPTGNRWIKMRDIATDDDGNVTVEEWLVR